MWSRFSDVEGSSKYKEPVLSHSRSGWCARLTTSSRNSHKTSKCSRTWHKKSYLLIEKCEREHNTRSCKIWEDDIKKDLTKMWCDNVNCFHGCGRAIGWFSWTGDWSFGFHKPLNLLTIWAITRMYLFLVYFLAPSTARADGAIATQWTGNGLDVGSHGLMWGQISYFFWGDSWKTRHISVRTTGYRTEIWTQDCPNTK
jgi:hypothetical protein